MKSKTTPLVAVLLSTVLLFLSGCGGIYRYAKSGEVGWALKKELRDKHSKEVDMTKLVKFQWDEFFVFNPYTSSADICKRLALSLDQCQKQIKSESTDDGETLLIFLKDRKIAHSEMHFRWHGDFTPARDEPFTSATAVFTVLVKDQGSMFEDWLSLRPKSATPLSN